MSQVDNNRNSSASKRARTDGSRREDDWTCSSCGNVNFSFRATCNKKNCSQPRPADHYSKSSAKSMQAPQGYSAASPFAGSAVPPSMYFGMPPYGSSLFNGTHVPPYEYDVPFSASSGYHYNYGSRLAAGGVYRPPTLSVPSPFSGGMYGIPPIMDRYGFGMPLTPSGMGPRPVFFPEDVPHQKDSTRDDDWTCPNCGNVNFSFRTVCNMRRCNTARHDGSQPAKLEKSYKLQMPDGSWKCEKCNNINYPFRMKCNRQNCGADKPSDLNRSASPALEENDQVREILLEATLTVTTYVYMYENKNTISINSILFIGICFAISVLVLFAFLSLGFAVSSLYVLIWYCLLFQ